MKMEKEKLLKEISLESSRELLENLSGGPKTATELREECDKLENRASFYKSLNRLSELGVVEKRYNPEAKRDVFELQVEKVTVDLEKNKVGIK